MSLEPDYTEELSQFSVSIMGEIVSRMLASDQKVTGKTIDSIEDDIRPTGVTIYAAPHIMALDTGRGPTIKGNSGGPTLRDTILQWIKDKGITPSEGTETKHYESLAFLIARRIHEQGTRLFFPGPPSGNITNVLTEKRIDAFIGTFSRKFMSFVQSEVLTSLNTKTNGR